MPEPLPRRPRSPAQIAAARLNGARSRGPRTPEGKARSSKNALAHGLAATVHLLTPGEDPAELERLREIFLKAYPTDRPSRALLLERLVAAAWKLRRAERLEAALHRLAPRAAPGRLDPDPGLPAALTRQAEYALLLRYQSRLEGFLLRALRLLEEPEPAAPPDPAPATLAGDPDPVEVEPGPTGQDEPTAGPMSASSEGTDTDAPAREAPAEDAEGAELADGPGPSAADPTEGEPTEEADPADDLHELARAAAARLLRDGRPLEAARLARLLGPPRRARETMRDPPDRADEEPLDPATAALLEEVDYRNWVVPPGTGRRPLASLTAEWVCRADRWRVLEELRRVDDPAERERVLGHWVRAGLDPGLDHPAYRGVVELPEPPAASPGPAEPRPDPARPPRLRALLIRLGQEAEAHHAVGRERQAREAWIRHARELGVPVPEHADLPEGVDRDGCSAAETEPWAEHASPGPGARLDVPNEPEPVPVRGGPTCARPQRAPLSRSRAGAGARAGQSRAEPCATAASLPSCRSTIGSISSSSAARGAGCTTDAARPISTSAVASP